MDKCTKIASFREEINKKNTFFFAKKSTNYFQLIEKIAKKNPYLVQNGSKWLRNDQKKVPASANFFFWDLRLTALFIEMKKINKKKFNLIY